MAAGIEKTSFSTAEKLVDYLLRVARSDRPALARGQADAAWQLLPSAWRSGVLKTRRDKIRRNEPNWEKELLGVKSPTDAAKKYLGKKKADDVARTQELVIQLRMEICLVQKFCGECDRAALPVPGHTSAGSQISIADHVGQFEDDLELRTPFVELGPAFAFAQHYLIPTRLLDFSDNPLKAAYFAVPVDSPADEFAIWLIRKDNSISESAPYFDDAQEMRVLRSQIPYLHAQDGLFLVCNVSSNRYFLETGKWPTIEKVLAGYTIEKIVCPSKIAKEVRKLLARLGINDTTMMPSYETVSKTLRATYVK